MADTIAFNPLRQNGSMTLFRAGPVSLTAGTPVRIVGQNPRRLLLVVVPLAGSSGLSLYPDGDVVGPFAVPATPAVPLCIHAAQYPLLCQEAWYVVSSVNVDVVIYQTITN